MTRPHCVSCLAPLNRGDLCRSCRTHYANAATYQPDDADALDGGRWVVVRGIRRWVDGDPLSSAEGIRRPASSSNPKEERPDDEP